MKPSISHSATPSVAPARNLAAIVTLAALLLLAPRPTLASPKPLTLKQAVAEAKRRNLSVRSGQAAVTGAREAKRGSYALLGPHLYASLGLSMLGGDSAFGSTGGSSTIDTSGLCTDPATQADCLSWMATNRAYTGQVVGAAMSGFADMGSIMNGDSFKLTLGLSWSLFNYKSYVNIDRAKVSLASQRTSLKSTTQDVVLNVTTAFYNVLAAEEGVRIARETATNTKAHLKQSRALLAAGNATKLDVLRWQSQAANDQQTVIEARQSLSNSHVTLNNLLGRPLKAPVKLAAPAAVSAQSLPRPRADTALKRTHPSLRLSQLNVRAAGLEVKNARAAFLPTLDLTAGYSWQRYLPYEDTSSMGWLGSWSVGLTLTIPIFDSATKIYEVRRTKAAKVKARLDARNTRRNLSEQLLRSNRQASATWQKLSAASKQLKLARAAHESATRLYRAGDAKTTDVLDAQKSLASARYNLLNARFGHLVALAQRDRAAGRIR